MNYEKILDEFIKDIKKEGTYATAEDIRTVAVDALNLIRKNKDASKGELIEKLLEDNINQLEEIRNNYPVPGYTIGIKVGDINVKLYGGNIDSRLRKMTDNALFDIASMTKYYTQIIAYNLIKEGKISFNDKIKDLDQRFENVGDLTVGEVLSFNVEFKTNGRLSDKSTIKEALDTLYQVQVVSKEKYNYNDMGMMLIKEVMENVTGKSYATLMNEYVIEKLNLKDTHLIVPSSKIERVTGSANASLGMVNDPNALAVGGYSGHAGLIVSSDDLIKLGEATYNGNIIPQDMISDAYTPGISDNRGIMGNTYTSNETGTEKSFVSTFEPKTNFAIQGSTRTQMNIGKDNVSTILLNPASMGLEQAREEEEKINKNRALKNQPPLSLVKHFVFEREGGSMQYNLVDARQMAISAGTVEPITNQNAKLILKLKFLNKVIEAYEKNYTEKVDIQKHN